MANDREEKKRRSLGAFDSSAIGHYALAILLSYLGARISVPPALDQLVEELRDADRQERIEMLLDLAKSLPPMPDRLSHFKDESHRVPECQSPVFLVVEREGDRVRLFADAPIEAPTVRGFVAMLIQGLDGEAVEEILKVPGDLVERSGMPEILGMLRINGLRGVLGRLKAMVARSAKNVGSPAASS